MKAIILAAGVGSRLRPLTDSIPKTLVEVGGRPILSYQIDALLANGVTDVVVCTGHLGDLIEADVDARYPGHRIRTVENVDYARTNNMYSLYLAREHLSGDVLIMNADVCFESNVVEALLESEGSAIAVDTSTYNAESMKVVADPYVSNISKTISEADAHGCSIDVYKFVAEDVVTLLEALTRIIEEEGDRNQWTEVLLQRLFEGGEIRARPCPIGDRWMEIDDHSDLNQAEKVFNPSFRALAARKVFFFDRDGTVSLGDTMIEGSHRLFEVLRGKGIPFYILTNNSSRTSREHWERMADLPISQEHVLVSTDAVIHYLHDVGIERIYVSATQSVTQYFGECGFEIVHTDPEAFVLTYNNEITYAGIRDLLEVVRSGVPYYATHTDLLYPFEGGFLPDIGCLIRMIESSTGRTPDMQFGKPAQSMITHVLERHGVGLSDAAIVGDRLYTDIALADDTEMLSVLVLSGETKREDLLTAKHKPEVIVGSVADLLELFDPPPSDAPTGPE